ncbi:MAG: phage/plasmid primase, P4 family [Gemella sp.]|nr:phage/plasmid primase, P4 family [Gemella sp.]
MAIYKQLGFKTKQLTLVKGNKPLFEMLQDYDVVDDTTDLQKYKEQTATYIIVGEMKPNEQGQYIRSNANIISRDYAFLDYDKIDISNADFINLVADKLQGFEYLLYPTIRHTEEKPRYRLVLPLERSAIEQEYKSTIQSIADCIGLKNDSSSATFSQLQGTPVVRKSQADNYKIIHITGEKYPVSEAKVTKRREKVQKTANILNSNDLKRMFELYLELDEPNLIDDYNNALSVIQTIVKEEIAGTIDVVTASDFVTLLAYDNEAYIKGNIDKYNAEKQQAVVNPNYIRTTYTFKDRFRACISGVVDKNKRKVFAQLWNKNYTNPVIDFTENKNYFDILENNPNINVIEMFQDIGYRWREENSTISEKNGKLYIPEMDFVTVTQLIKQHIPFIKVGETKDTSTLYYYDFKQGIYVHSISEIESYINALEYRYKPRYYSEVINKLKNENEVEYVEEMPEYLKNYIPVNNGLFNVNSQKLEPFSYKHYITSKEATNYNIEAENPVEYFDVDKWFKAIANYDDEIELLLWQLVNEAINGNNTREKIAILLGSGKNGKGTFQAMLRNLIGKKNVSALKMHQFSNKFDKAKLLGAICNIGDDIENSYLDEVGDLKTIATGDPLTIDRKNKDPLTIITKVLLIFSANEIPKTRDKSDAFLNRLLIIPFNADFNGEVQDKSIKEEKLKNPKVLEYILKKAIEMKFDKFIEPKAVKKARADYKAENDTVNDYMNNSYIIRGFHNLDVVATAFINADYKAYCEKALNTKPRANIAKDLARNLNSEFKKDGVSYYTKNARYTKEHLEQYSDFDKEYYHDDKEGNPNFNHYLNDIPSMKLIREKR